MSVSIRAMRPEDARRFLEIQRESVRGIAARDYSTAVIEAWAPLPITDEAIERFLSNRDDEMRLIAEIDEQAVGIGALVPSNSELRACYIVPGAARRGIGAAIVAEIERIAREHQLDYLRLESSLTAEPFYAALGYRVEARGELMIASGVPMAAITMSKRLGADHCSRAVQPVEPANFSGVWELNLEKSRLTGAPPRRITVRIDHDANTIRQSVLVMSASGHEQRHSFTFSTTGVAAPVTFGSNVGATSARWKESTLIVESRVPVGGRELHFRDHWSLSPDGAVLTMAHPDDDLAGQVSVLERAPSKSREVLSRETNH